MGCWEERIGRFRDKQLFLWKRFCQSFWHTKSPLSPYTMESRQVHSEEPMNLLWLNLLHVYDGEQNWFLFSVLKQLSARIALADDCSRWWRRSSLLHFIVLAKSWSLQWSTNSWWHCTKLVSLSRFLSEPLWLIWSLCLPLFLPNSCDSINWRNFGFKFL